MPSCFKGALLFLSFLILFLSFIIYNQLEPNIEIIELSKETTSAQCLDGSNYKFLFQKGTGNNTKSFMLYFEPGGFCGYHKEHPIPACIRRKETFLGNNNFSFINRIFLSYFSRLMSSKPHYNPNFHNWNKVFVRYCDGALFQGNHTLTHLNGSLYLHGENNVKEIINYLKQTYSFDSAENILLSGSSAGGIGAMIWANYISNQAPQATMNVISDSGYVMDFNSSFYNKRHIFREMMLNLTEGLNLSYSNSMSSYCTVPNEERWKCFIPKYFIRNLKPKIKVLIVQSVYDSWMMNTFIGTNCFHQSIQVLDYCNDNEMMQFKNHEELLINELNEMNRNKGHITAWLGKGSYHAPMYFGWLWDSKDYAVEGYTLTQMMNLWYHNNTTVLGKIFLQDNIPTRQKDIAWYIHYFESFINYIIDSD